MRRVRMLPSPGRASKRQRGRAFHFGPRVSRNDRRLRIRHVDAEAFGHGTRETLVDVHELRHHAFANGRHLNLRQLEAVRADDVRLLDRRLTLVEQCRLCVVIRELRGFAAHLVFLDGLRKGLEAARTRLERAATAQ